MTMSSFSETTPYSVDESAATDRQDHASLPRRSRDKLAENHIPSLTALAGLCLVTEAYDFFEELQADLSSIKIQGDDVDELWCTLDWQRYVLGLWAMQIKKSSCVPERNWVAIKESWEVIIQTTVSLNLSYAHPSDSHQRPNCEDNTESLAFGKIFQDDWYDSILNEDEMTLVDSILQATDEEEWSTPFFHERAFTGLIESIMDDLAKSCSSVQLQEQRRSGIESTRFKGFIKVLDKEIKNLIILSTAEKQEEVYMGLDRAWRTVLLRSITNVDTSIRYHQFYHSLMSAWPFNNDTLTIGIEIIFQERVQELFGHLICCSYDSSRPQSFPYTVKQLEDILALGGDVRGEVKGRRDCVLWIAATLNNYDFFKALVHAGAPYTMEPDLEESPLQAAAKAGNIDIVAFLLNSEQHFLRININHQDIHDRTALHEAAENCHESVIKVLLQQPGIDVNPRNYAGYTPFLLAVQASANLPKKYASIKILLRDKRVDCNVRARGSVNAVHLAARSRDATLKMIIRHVKGINDQNEYEKTPLHYAVECNSKPNVEILLAHGADPTVTDNTGYTPLLRACDKLHLGPMKLLLSHPESLKRLSPELTEERQWRRMTDIHPSPVTLVLSDYPFASTGKRAHIILALRAILAAKPDLETRNDIGQSVLNYVIESVDECVVLELLRAGADVNSRDDDGRTPLHRFMRSDSSHSPEKVELLLEWGADIGLKDKDGQAPVPADWVSRHKKLLKVIEDRTREKAEAQQQENLRVLAEQTKAYAKKQKQRETTRNRPQASSNPFAVLPVEGMESTETDLEV